MKSKPPWSVRARISRSVANTSFVFSARCCTPAPPFCSRYVCAGAPVLRGRPPRPSVLQRQVLHARAADLLQVRLRGRAGAQRQTCKRHPASAPDAAGPRRRSAPGARGGAPMQGMQ